MGRRKSCRVGVGMVNSHIGDIGRTVVALVAWCYTSLSRRLVVMLKRIVRIDISGMGNGISIKIHK